MTYQIVRLGFRAKKWGVSDGDKVVAQNLTWKKAKHRASNLNHGLCDFTGKFYTKK